MNSNIFIVFGAGIVLVLALIFEAPVMLLYALSLGMLFLSMLAISLDALLITLIFIRPSLDILGGMGVQIAGLPSVNIAGLTALLSLALTVAIIFQRQKKVLHIPLSRYILLFLGVHGAFILRAEELGLAINEFVRLASFLLIFFAGYTIIQSREDLQLMIRVFIFSSLFPVLVASLQLVTGQGIYSNPGFDNRIMGTFGHPSVLAYYLLIIISLIFYLFFDHQIEKKDRDLMVVYTGILIVLLINTYTRGAWIGLFLLILGVLFIRSPRKTLQGITISIPSMGFIAIAYSWLQTEVFFGWPRLAGIPIISRLLGLFSGDPSDSILWRQQMWADMFAKGMEAPLLGFGTGMVEVTTERVRGIALGALEIHNDYIKVFIETGIWGVIAFIALGLAAFAVLLKKLKSRHDMLVLMMMSIVLTLYFSAIYDNILRQTAVMWIFFALLGMVIKYIYSIRDTEDHTRIDAVLEGE